MLHCLRNCLICFPPWPHYFIFLPTSLWSLHTISNTCSDFFNTAILTDIKCDLFVVIICISLMTKDVRHLLMCFLAIWGIFLGEMALQNLCSFFNWVVFLLSCSVSSFHFLNGILWTADDFNFDKILNYLFFLVPCAFGVLRIFPKSDVIRFTFVFSSKNVIV